MLSVGDGSHQTLIVPSLRISPRAIFKRVGRDHD
jgi:hypothetical protein